ncbi:MAG: hypothetical protein H6734_07590 [Alphaproteobacteria bacterium]|nr:hypothetical protein [Alphaproteobacteria bacterium]
MVPATEGLHPLLPERVWLAVTQDGAAVGEPPVVAARGGKVRFGGDGSLPGVWPLVVTADADAREVELTIRSVDHTQTVSLPVTWPDRGHLTLPARTDVIAQEGRFEVLLTGEDLPAPDLLDVVVGEGEVVGVDVVPDGIQITLEPLDSPAARVFSIGVRDLRTPDLPAWGEVRVRARPRVPLEAEPGATVTLAVGERSYGPFVADENGRISARVDQFPGENAVTARLVDDLGNEAVTTLPLADPQVPALVAMAGDRGSVERAPRVVWVRAVHPAGRTWTGEAPTCRSPAVGALDVVAVVPGLYAVPLDGRVRAGAADIRVECRLEDAATSVRVGRRSGLPAHVLLQVWPTELSTDLPVAEVRVALEDAQGSRLDPDGVEVQAVHGRIQRVELRGEVLTAEYDGTRAVEPGTDTLVARYRHPVSEDPPVSLGLRWTDTPVAGELRLEATARDAMGRPVRGAGVSVSLGEEAVEGTTDDAGVALLRVPVPAGNGPLRIVASSGRALLRALAVRGTLGAFTVDSRGSVEPLESSRVLSLSPGRVSGISVAFDPPILRTGRNSMAYVTVALEDRAGRPVLDESVALDVTEGRVGPLVARPDGTLVAEYRPDEGDRAREVVLTASTDTLKSSARLELEPRLGRVMVGPTVGWTTNLGLVSSPRVGFVADIRTGLLGETVLVRGAFGGYGVSGRASTGIGDDVELVGSVLPAQVALLLRQDRAGVGFWGGAGGMVAIHALQARFGGALVAEGTRALSGGTVLGGMGYRLGVADVVGELEWSFIPGPGGDLAFTGNLGGLTASAGFRLVY